jgi:hypothetical protein
VGLIVRFGRLIRVGNRREGAGAVYVVAEADPVKAMDVIRHNVAGPNVELEDLGRVTDQLLNALALGEGPVHSHVT